MQDCNVTNIAHTNNMITIKTKKEIETLKEGGRRHAQILKEIAKEAVSGVSTKFLNDFAIKKIEEFGDRPAFLNYKPKGSMRPYPAALCVSVNDEIVHGIPNEKNRIIKDGDIVTFDLGLIHKDLITDAAITVGVGKISKEDKKLIKATREALKAAVNVAKEGNTTGDIGQAVQDIAEKYGFGIAEGLSGHGVGYSVHEDPYIPNIGVRGQGEKLVAGMVIAIEPMFTTGKGGIVLDKDGYTYKTKDASNAAHFEHTVAITDGKPVVLTE